MTAAECLRVIRDRLAAAGIESSDYESRVFLEWLAGIDRAEFFFNPGKEILPEQWERIDGMVARREKREPLQYLMGSCDFMGYEFYVDERVLIPRQDTECLVELAMETMKEVMDQKGQAELSLLDLCTGSGCIGISMKLYFPSLKVMLSDISPAALCVAKRNAESLHAEVDLVEGDLFERAKGPYDMILSNPPYIPSEVCLGLMPEVKDHEPMLALDGAADGLAFYRRIIEEAPAHLKEGGWLMFEIGADQGEAVADLMRKRGFSKVSIKQDLAGLDRIVAGQMSLA